MISLDTSGADPDLTTPFFTFQTNSGGSYFASYHNVSNPAVDFVKLTLVAPFSSPTTFAAAQGSSCNGTTYFTVCNINYDSTALTVTFVFSGLDSTHHGLPYGGTVPLSASQFLPNQTVAATAGTAPAGTSTPEPSTLILAASALLIAGLTVSRKKLFEFRVRL